MTREEFLKLKWQPYPEAQPDWKDVAAFRLQPHGFVCGRLSGERSILESAGESISVQITENCRWLGLESDFLPSVLRDGDLVCIEIINDVVTNCLLLAPARDSFHLESKFSVSRS